VKGIKALGNQLTSEKVKQINALEPEIPEVSSIEQEGNNNLGTGVNNEVDGNSDKNSDEESQTTLF